MVLLESGCECEKTDHIGASSRKLVMLENSRDAGRPNHRVMSPKTESTRHFEYTLGMKIQLAQKKISCVYI